MELRFLLLLLLCISGFQAQQYDSVESRVEGQSLTVECHYNAWRYSEVPKVWCQQRDGICSPVLITPFASACRDLTRSTSRKTTIQDNTLNGIVTITMKNLKVEDSGVYSCAHCDPPNTLFALKIIKLDVSKAVQKYSAVEGQTLSLQCPYNSPDYKGQRKAWCRRTVWNPCAVLVNTDYWILEHTYLYRERVQKGRAVIHDDTQKGLVTITMERLREDDSGEYLCVLYVPPDIYRIIEVKLTVTKAPTTTDVPLTTSTGHTSPVLTTAIAGLSPTQSSLFSTETTFIILGVVLGLLFILALIGVVKLCTRKSRQLMSRGGEQAEETYEEPRSTTVPQGFSNAKDPKDDKQEMPQDLKYATLDFKPRPSPKESVYANVMPLQALEMPHTRSSSTEPVEYASVSRKPLASGARQ